MNRYQKEILDVAKLIRGFGYQVYLSGDHEHGFFTDGKRCVSFEWDLRGILISGNYKRTTQHGTGWVIGVLSTIDKEVLDKAIKSNAHHFPDAIYVTPDEHLTHFSTSKYNLFNDKNIIL